jgi:myo-inositol-1(or 4)-monophosphatase
VSDELLDVAVAAARAAGALLRERFEGGPAAAGAISAKSTPTDLVSEADLAAERAIRAILRERRPDDAILGEEGDDVAGTSGLRWVVDPLDGTINFLFGIPQWCVSVACEDRVGVVFDPLRDELFAVGRDGVATLGGAPLRASGRGELATALVATGFGYAAGVRERQAAIVARVLPAVRDIRRAGSAALDLAWTAAGRLDAYYEFGVQPWDIAAGTQLCRAVGLEVTALPADDGLPAGIAVAPPAIGPALLGLLGREAPAG